MTQPCLTLDNAPDVLTVEQMSNILGIGRTAAYEVIRRGKIRTIRAGRLIKVPKLALVEVLAQGAVL
ncbi:MAG: helix-turn-helix domain-containing protein [Candidatus Eremiobacteraeota bacterium]|nr:helix-turn-helix domain-containing protein [Candidatus Eremiobacteraeota bacterium]MBC5826823.1 helix-turn-helix domain-containing protein [Candidatus Eremiobacteraeota bacterium]